MLCSRFLQSMCMFKLIAVTDRKNARYDLTQQIKVIAASRFKPAMLILREKDLSDGNYRELARKLSRWCEEHGIEFYAHNFWQAALSLQIKNVQLPLQVFLSEAFQQNKNCFQNIGVAVHSIQEAKTAEQKGADFIIAGHIYQTECKKGLSPKGCCFLHDICSAVGIPVYAIGGIDFSEDKLQHIKACGAAGACIRSAYMKISI